jgi:hypothetical protein
MHAWMFAAVHACDAMNVVAVSLHPLKTAVVRGPFTAHTQVCFMVQLINFTQWGISMQRSTQC